MQKNAPGSPPVLEPDNAAVQANRAAPSRPAAPADDAAKRAMRSLEAAEAALAEAALEEAREAARTERPGSSQPAPEADARKRTRLSLSVIMPVFNERDTIHEILQRVRQVGLHDEIIIVDDCSTDGTRDLLIELDQDEDIRVVMHGYNRGKGAALRTAMRYVHGDVVIVQDADLEYDPADYARLLGPIERGEADVVYGSRFLENAEQDPSRLHRLGNRMLTTASNLTTGLRLTDMETCYKAFRSGVVRGMVLRQNRFGFEPEFTAKIARRKCRIVELPVRYNSRGYEEGKKIGIRDAINALYCILRYAWCD